MIGLMPIQRSSGAYRIWRGQRPFQHWYRDNQVYFITARCRGRFPALASEAAKAVFWSRFDACARDFDFVPWVTSLLDNHYHTLGYLRQGANLGPMMRRLHGSVAKLVNDITQSQTPWAAPPPPLGSDGRLLPFWRDTNNHNYFDGCLRDEKQGRLTYRYILTQSRRHGITDDWRRYPHTHVGVELEQAIQRATELKAFLYGVRYPRYESGP
jgi:REP element-mobilizing transposase RayT